MQTYFPDAISFSQTNIPIRGSLSACFTFSLVFAIDRRIAMPESCIFIPPCDLPDKGSDSKVLLPSLAWASFLEVLEGESLLDYGVPKLFSEWLMAGSAFGHGQKAVSVSASVGQLSREFMVTGDSQDFALNIIDPQPFEKMPLTWRNTFGGFGHLENPLGKGMQSDERGVFELPNVYDKENFAQNNARVPACPQGKSALARGFYSQQGFSAFPKSMGTYDDLWLKKYFPSAPEDFDWKFYNLAQPAQILQTPASESGVFRGLDPIRITNMHESFPEIMGYIPPYRLRFFIEYAKEPKINIEGQIPHLSKLLPKEEGQWHEVLPQADTLWLLPNSNMGVLMWHASAPTVSEANIDILNLAAHLEDCREPLKDASVCIALALAQKEAVLADIPETNEEIINEDPIKEEIIKEETPSELDISLKEKAFAKTDYALGAVSASSLIEKALAKKPEETIDDVISQAEEVINASIDVTNEKLKELGLPLLESEDVKAKMLEISTKMDEFTQKKVPSPEQILLEAGMSKDEANAYISAMKIEAPCEFDFTNKAEYKVALEGFFTALGTATGASPSFASSMMGKMDMIDDVLAQGNFLDSLSSEQASLKILRDAGISESDAKRLTQAFNLAVPDDNSQESLCAYFQEFDRVANFPNNNLTTSAINTINELRTLQYAYGADDILAGIAQSGVEIPASQVPAFNAFSDALKKVSITKGLPPNMDLSALAISCGIFSPALLDAISAQDLIPLKTPLKLSEEVSSNPLEEQDIKAPKNPEAITPETEADETVVDDISPTNAEEFKQALIDKVDLTSHNLAGINLTGLDLSDLTPESLALCAMLSLEGACFVSAKLGKANFAQAQLTGADLTGADFSACDLSGANLANCIIKETLFDKALLKQSIFDESIFHGASFKDCQALHSTWKKVEMQTCDFTNANLSFSTWEESTISAQNMANALFSHAYFFTASLENCQFQGDLARVTFEDCTLKNVSFDNTNLSMGRFYYSQLLDCSMNNVDLSKSNWTSVVAKKLPLDCALLDDALFEKVDLAKALLTRVSAKNCIFQSCDLTDIQCPYINLMKGSLRDSMLARANFSNANLYGVDFYLARTSPETNFENADLTATMLTRSI